MSQEGPIASAAVAAGAVNTTQLVDKAVTLAKMADLAVDKIIGRATAGTGVPEAIACTAAGRALIDDANASAQLTTLGVSTFAKTILDDADAAAVRTTLGITSGAIRYCIPVTWYRDNVIINLTADPLATRGGGLKWAAPRDGSLVSIFCLMSTTVTAGTLNVFLRVNGVAVWLLSMDGGPVFNEGVAAAGTYPYVAGDLIDAVITTDAGFLPITLDLELWAQVQDAS